MAPSLCVGVACRHWVQSLLFEVCLISILTCFPSSATTPVGTSAPHFPARDAVSTPSIHQVGAWRTIVSSRQLVLRGGSTGQEAPRELGDGWFEYFDPNHNIPFYYNVHTQVTQWEIPVPHTQGQCASPPTAELQQPKAESVAPGLGLTSTPGQTSGPSTSAYVPHIMKSTSMPANLAESGVPSLGANMQWKRAQSEVSVAGLNVMDTDHAGVLGGYVGGLLNDAIDVATKPMESVLGAFANVAQKLVDTSQKPKEAVDPLTLDMSGCGSSREEWQVAQGRNDKTDRYLTLRHRRFGTVLELYEDSENGSFNFITRDHTLVRRVISITDFVTENRDWTFCPWLIEELRSNCDSDKNSLLRHPKIENGRWTLSTGASGIGHVWIQHDAESDKNQVCFFLIPDGFIYIHRGNINNLDEYRNRSVLVVRKGSMVEEMSIVKVKKFLADLYGPIEGLTYFVGNEVDGPQGYEQLLQEGERLQGHSRSLEERWRFRGRQVKVVWGNFYKTCDMHFEDSENGVQASTACAPPSDHSGTGIKGAASADQSMTSGQELGQQGATQLQPCAVQSAHDVLTAAAPETHTAPAPS